MREDRKRVQAGRFVEGYKVILTHTSVRAKQEFILLHSFSLNPLSYYSPHLKETPPRPPRQRLVAFPVISLRPVSTFRNFLKMATPADFARIGNYAIMYNPDPNIDRSTCHRTVPMQVLCPGYSRTGTLTMQKALGILGIPAYHFSSILGNVREVDLWMEALEGKYNGKGNARELDRGFWDGLLGHVGGVTDSPTNLFTRELLEAYPEVKVVLVEREMQSWLRSWSAYCEGAYGPLLHLLGRLDPYWTGRVTGLGGFITIVQAGFATDVHQARVRSRDAYNHHYRDVREMVTDKKRLLEFELRQGWEPLCEFLGKPVPVCSYTSLFFTPLESGTLTWGSPFFGAGRPLPTRERKGGESEGLRRDWDYRDQAYFAECIVGIDGSGDSRRGGVVVSSGSEVRSDKRCKRRRESLGLLLESYCV